MGFDDPALASYPTGANLYFEQEQKLFGASPGEPGPGQYDIGQEGAGQRYAQTNEQTPDLTFGGEAINAKGEVIPMAAASPSSTGHWKEILNFQGSPAPWILLGILLVAGILGLSAKGSVSGGVRL